MPKHATHPQQSIGAKAIHDVARPLEAERHPHEAQTREITFDPPAMLTHGSQGPYTFPFCLSRRLRIGVVLTHIGIVQADGVAVHR